MTRFGRSDPRSASRSGVLRAALVTLAGLGVLDLVARLPFPLPSPVTFAALIVVGCTFLDGTVGGLTSALLSIAFAALDGFGGGRVFPAGELWLPRLVAACITLPAFALILGRWRGAAGRAAGAAPTADGGDSARPHPIGGDDTRFPDGLPDLHTLMDHAADAVYVCDIDGGIVDVNRAACDMLGYSRDELRALRVPDIEVDIEPAQVAENTRSVIGAGPSVIEGGHRRKDGSIIAVELSLAAFERAGTPLVLAIARDITERTRIERRVRQSQKMDAVGRLAGGVAHDFNNLLTAIKGSTALLLQELPADHTNRADVDEITRAADRAADLTRQLLAFSRRQIFQPELLAPSAVIRNMERALRRFVGEAIEVEFDFSGTASVLADGSQIEQVLLNLVANARDAMPEGGVLTISTRHVDMDRRPSGAQSFVPPGRYFEMTISDTGPGMDADTMLRIFEPFFTTRSPGRGLGLATAYGIVKQSEGYLIPESSVGVGSTFRVLLPRHDDEVPAAPPARMAPPREGGSETVLVVEDEDAVRSLVVRVLKKKGYTVIDAPDGEAALRLAHDFEERIDLLISDLVMPRLNGRELVRRLAVARPETRVLLMSGYSDDVIVPQGAMGAVTPFMGKPFTPEQLARTVRDVLDA